jgi:prevent-host-death family protein
MPKEYSLYEAKAKLSEIVRRVRERGESVTISYHGEPVAEIRPISPQAGTALEKRIARLAASGSVVRSISPTPPIKAIAKKRGALKRFLEDRD